MRLAVSILLGSFLTLFALEFTQAEPCDFWFKKVHAPFSLRTYGPLIQSLSAQVPPFRGMNLLYRDLRRTPSDLNIFDRILKIINARYTFNPDGLMKIPKTGPVIIAVTHPTGILDGPLAGSLIYNHVRKDIKFMDTNAMEALEEFRPFAIIVDNSGDPNNRSEATQSANIKALRKTIEHLGVYNQKTGEYRNTPGVLIVHPGDYVAHSPKKGEPVQEHAWAENIFKLAIKQNATVVPVSIEAENSKFFSQVGYWHPIFRTMRLAREFRGHSNEVIPLTIGDPISPDELKQISEKVSAGEFVRDRALWLPQLRMFTRPDTKSPSHNMQKVRTTGLPAGIVADEISKLTPLHETEKYLYYVATADQIPNIVLEIGRLRELSFREAKEGFGFARDLSEYDYFSSWQIFAVDKETHEIRGGLRLAKGTKYVSEGFDIPSGSFPDSTLEFSRLWVRHDRVDNTLLDALFGMIGKFIGKHPEFTGLIGVPSFSKATKPEQQAMVIDVLKQELEEAPMASLVKPKRPLQLPKNPHPEVKTFKQLKSIDGLDIPPVFAAYKLFRAKRVGFNIDSAFGSIDTLLYIPIKDMPLRNLKRWMKEDDLRAYANLHGLDLNGAK